MSADEQIARNESRIARIERVFASFVKLSGGNCPLHAGRDPYPDCDLCEGIVADQRDAQHAREREEEGNG